MVFDVKQKQTHKELWNNRHSSIPHLIILLFLERFDALPNIVDSQAAGFRLTTTATCTVPYSNVHHIRGRSSRVHFWYLTASCLSTKMMVAEFLHNPD
jgi:hypothetical protein